MRISALELLAFGPFTDRILEFEGNGPHLVYGPNEAGKSSALRALNAFFFGIPVRTDDDFIHGKPSLRVGMRLESGQGEPLHLHRIKRSKDTLIRVSDGNVVKEHVLSRLLGGLSNELFRSLYGLDYAGLEQGAEALLQGRGELGSALFAAGAGLANLYQVQQELERRANDLYKSPRGKNQLNQLKKDYSVLRQQIREVQAGSEEWENHLRAREEAENEKHMLDAELQEVLKEKNRLERIQTALPDIVDRAELLNERESLAGVRLLPEEFAEDRQNAVTSQQIAREQCDQSRKELQLLDQELAGLAPPTSLLDAGETILRLTKDLNRIRGQRSEFFALRQNLAGIREHIDDLTLALPKPLVCAGSQVLIDRAQETRIGKLIDLGLKLLAEKEQYAALLEQRTLEVRQARSALSALPSGKDLSALAATVETFSQQGDVEKRLAEAEADNQRRWQDLRNGLARQARWSGPVESLPALALPDEALIEQHGAAFQECAAAAVRLEGELQQARTELVSIRADMEALAAGESILGEEDLKRTRRRRDAGWELVLDAWEQGMSKDEAGHDYVAACAGAADLAQAYAQAVEEADGVADRLRREAERVASYAALKSRLQVALAAEAAATAKLEHVAQDRARNTESWRMLWQPLDMVPGSPQEMRNWTRQVAELVRQAGELEQGRARARQLGENLQQMRSALLARMAESGLAEQDAGAGFAELLYVCRKKIQELRTVEQQRAHLDEQQRTLSARLAQQQEAVRQLDERYQGWRTDWAGAVADLGLDARAYPEEARDVLALLRELHGLHERLGEDQNKLDVLSASLQNFANESHELVARLAPELLPAGMAEDRLAELDSALEELEARLVRARQAAALRTETLKRRTSAQRNCQQAEQAAALAETRLQALCDLAGCATAGDLAPALERSDRLRRCSSRLEEVEERLRRQSMGLPLEDFVHRALEQDAEALAPRLELLAQRAMELGERRSELDRTIGSEQAALNRMRGEDDAARLAEDAEGVLAGMAESVENYISLVIAQKMLRQAMESYREKVQGGIVRQAGEYFSRITLGAFSGVRVENHGGGDMLVGVRTRAAAGLRVESMSSGSRDQLFLALRLASLSALLDEAEPTPLILDDILVNFDDQRAVETLQLLRDMAQRTQVVYFTHHQHIQELAKGWRNHQL